MSRDALHSLLHTLRDGRKDPALIAAVRALLADTPLAGTDLIEQVFAADSEVSAAEDAALVLELLADLEADAAQVASGVTPRPSGLLASALFAEAGSMRAQPATDETVSDAVMSALFGDAPSDVAPAVKEEAGSTADLARGFDPDAVAVSEAVHAEAGTVHDLAAEFDADDMVSQHLAAALLAEAGTVDVVSAVFAQLPSSAPVADLHPAEAPHAATADLHLSAMFDGELRGAERTALGLAIREDAALLEHMTWLADFGRSLREATKDEAGACEGVWPAVATEMGLSHPEDVPGWNGSHFADQVRAAAGTVNIADAVMREIARGAEVPEPVLPEPVSQSGWMVGAAVLVAAAVLIVMMPQLVGMTEDADGPIEAPGVASEVLRMAELATQDEVELVEIEGAEDATLRVSPPVGDSPLIIWVDDGVQL